MKYLSLLVILGIIYLVATQMGSSSSGTKSSFAKAEAEAAQVDPRNQAPVVAGATPAPTSLRAPLKRAQDLQGVVKQRNGDGDF